MSRVVAPAVIPAVAPRRLLGLLGLVLVLTGCGGGLPSAETPPQGTSEARGPENGSGPILILISLDGFRWDYPEVHGAPTLLKLAAEGARAAGLVPVFPSMTFPNHYSLVTGLYAESHGIVGNNMWDPVWQASFSLGNREEVENGRWWDGEPIWVTAERQGLRAATYYWPGSEAEIGGVRPSYWKTFDDEVPAERRIAQVFEWLELPPGRRPSLITLYFSDVDGAGHRFGPAADETRQAVRRVDGYLASLVAGLEARGLDDRASLVVTSDHGMAAMDPDQVLVLEELIDLADVHIVDLSSIAMLRPRPGRESAVYESLRNAHPALHVYRRAEVPERLRFREHRRIPPIVAWTDPGWYIYATAGQREAARARFPLGMHGFDGAEADMRGIFVASGPAFRRGLAIPAVENVHLYELMARALGLEPAANDGDPSALAAILASAAWESAESAR